MLSQLGPSILEEKLLFRLIIAFKSSQTIKLGILEHFFFTVDLLGEF